MDDLAGIEDYVREKYPAFGINKRREIVRLIFEIARKEKVSFQEIFSFLKGSDYRSIKKWLIERRYPGFKKEGDLELYLPEVKIFPEYKFKPEQNFSFTPQNIYIERNTEGSYLVRRLRESFPQAKLVKIDTLKNYLKDKKMDLGDYNRRRENIFIVYEKYDFFKRCPCTKNAFFCGYNIFNLGLGCIYECVYCYLQFYLKNTPGIILPINLNDFFRNFPKQFYVSQIFQKSRLGTGEFSDSLALDNLTEWSGELIDFFRKRAEVYFEFKTKSKNIDNLLKIKPAQNIVVSWSLNPQNIVDSFEFYTASLEERVLSAKACAEYGYKVGFHFDPLIYYKKWEEDYQNLINLLFRHISEEKIAWISLGTLRFNPTLKKIIENRFPDSSLLDTDLFLDFDNKLRYPPHLRIMMYRKILSWIRKAGGEIPVYLCMEDKEVWRSVYGA